MALTKNWKIAIYSILGLFGVGMLIGLASFLNM